MQEEHDRYGPEYKGRPMTKETRAFLNLSLESRTDRIRIRRERLKLLGKSTTTDLEDFRSGDMLLVEALVMRTFPKVDNWYT